MTLIEAVRDLWNYDDHDAIYAREPWTAQSEALFAAATKEQGHELFARGFVGLFPVHVARDFLSGWFENVEERPTLEEQCARIIHYAIYDA